jgi:vacuolar-type H+-ATPase subunit E/Vma4
MESVEKGSAALIEGIQADAQTQRERIIKDATAQAAEKRKYGDKKIESILKNAQRKGQEQADTIKRKALSQVELEVKRHALHFRDMLMQDIMEQVKKKLSTLVSQKDYPSVLVDWVTEAALGLGVDCAHINASPEERALISDKLLAEVTKKLAAHSSKPITLTLSDAQPLDTQGILLTAADGRVAFNNQVETRILRNQRKIHQLIYEAVFAVQQEDQL